MSDIDCINDRIRDIKEKHSLKHSDISDITGYSVSSIKKWMMDEEHQFFQKAPVQALRLLDNWISLQDRTGVEESDVEDQCLAEIWSFLNFKGGVGKTTVAFNICLMLSKKKKVLVIDGDPQGHLSSSLIKDPIDMKFTTSDLVMGRSGKPYQLSENLHVIGTNNSLANTCEAIPASDLLFLIKENLLEYKSKYDYIIIDSLPSKGALYDSIMAASNKIIVPFTPDLYDSWGLQDVYQQVKKLKMRKINDKVKVAALIPNRVEKPLRNFDRDVINIVKKTFPNEICPTFISNSVRLRECKSPAIAMSIVDYAPNENVSKEYEAVLEYIINS
ncbi:ParA family protein [Legionella feeleii]|uniref:Sporulation initiation inhibitor protein Soj n=1 Tax=Legionella feeleii TaxID=453 RepID=A0A0W0TJ47_9GAMM|nr:ParA family protein [Legionella feeleii]KTC95205.1 sporulation initiation inhibitor protein Soj [Legionella feeleii]SPX61886.1 sporulation initiation inhibitor protein Soj [Legionella feeleii]